MTSRTRRLLVFAFVAYLVLLIYGLFLSPYFGRTQGNVHGVNLIPFAEIKRFYNGPESLANRLFWLNIVGNIVVFIPLGLFVAMLTRK